MQKLKGKQQWTQEQKKLIANLFPIYPSKKWKTISIQMAKKGFKRTELECRQKWINFLDPNLNNEEWVQQQLQKLYSLHDKYGTRWCFMQKELNRTQNKIKNRFYGTIRNYVRLIMNTLCQRNNCFNAQINKISPSLLNDLYNSQNVFDFLRGEVRKMIFRMHFKIDKKILKNRIRDRQLLYKELIGLLASLFKGSFSLKILDKIQDHSQGEDLQENQEDNQDQKSEKPKLMEGNSNIKQQEIQITSKKTQKQHNKGQKIKANEEKLHSQQKIEVKNQILEILPIQKISLQDKGDVKLAENPSANIKDLTSPLHFLEHLPLFTPQLTHQHPYNPLQMNHSIQQALMMDRMMPNQLIFDSTIDRIRHQSVLMMMMQQREMIVRQYMNQDNQQFH